MSSLSLPPTKSGSRFARRAARAPRPGLIEHLGRTVVDLVTLLGSLAEFGMRTCLGMLRPVPLRQLLPCLDRIGVQSVPVIIVTGAFIGMVLAVQAYTQFAQIHMENRIGGVINASLVKELGPVLAGLMLAGRVGSAMAAEIGTMQVTEQVDALRALGASPIRTLAVPRLLSCLLLIPLLTAIADACGIIGGWAFVSFVCDVNSYEYWSFSLQFVAGFEVLSGLVKSLFFGAVIAIIGCHRGFHAKAGAEGVGRAATEAFVLSFVAILVLDFFLGLLANSIFFALWPNAVGLF